jgi:hypothetical protein
MRPGIWRTASFHVVQEPRSRETHTTAISATGRSQPRAFRPKSSASSSAPRPPCWSRVAAISTGHEPRCPAQGALYQIVLDHFETFRAQTASLRDGEGLPRFVEQEFRDFLQCGWLAGGFGRFWRPGPGLRAVVRRHLSSAAGDLGYLLDGDEPHARRGPLQRGRGNDARHASSPSELSRDSLSDGASVKRHS